MAKLSCFKAYDIRGRIPDELNDALAYQIGQSYAAFVKPKLVAVGGDIRESSVQLRDALTRGLTDSGVDVADIGLCGTEGVYFATFAEELDGGIMVTASHNPPDYNGMKFVREGSRPISANTGLKVMQELIEEQRLPAKAARPGTVRALDTSRSETEHLLVYVDVSKLRPLKVVVNAGNGGAGLIIDALEPYLPFEFIKINHTADGSFPNGVPNPMLEPNRAAAPIWGSRGMATTTAAFYSMSTAASSRAITWSACSPRAFCAVTAVRASCTIRASPGTPSRSCSNAGACRCCASRDTRSSSRRCARLMRSTAGR